MPKTQVPKRTVHGDERMRERGISSRQAADAIINPLERTPTKTDDIGRKAYKAIGREATVVVNPNTGEIVTAYKTSSKVRKKHEAQ